MSTKMSGALPTTRTVQHDLDCCCLSAQKVVERGWKVVLSACATGLKTGQQRDLTELIFYMCLLLLSLFSFPSF